MNTYPKNRQINPSADNDNAELYTISYEQYCVCMCVPSKCICLNRKALKKLSIYTQSTSFIYIF